MLRVASCFIQHFSYKMECLIHVLINNLQSCFALAFGNFVWSKYRLTYFHIFQKLSIKILAFLVMKGTKKVHYLFLYEKFSWIYYFFIAFRGKGGNKEKMQKLIFFYQDPQNLQNLSTFLLHIYIYIYGNFVLDSSLHRRLCRKLY